MPSLSGYYLPAGIYTAEGEDANGVYFKAPAGVRLLSLAGSTEVTGGIYLPKQGRAGVRGFAYLNLPVRGRESYFLPDVFFAAFGKSWIIFPEGRPEEPSQWSIELSRPGRPESGPCRIYDSRHRLMMAGVLHEGKMDGKWTSFASDGSRLAEMSFRAGVPDGPVIMWFGPFAYPDARGRVKLSGVFRNGKFDGVVTRYHPSGSKRCVRRYDHGVLVQAQLWSPDGVKQPAAWAEREAVDELKADRTYVNDLETIVRQALAKARRISTG